MYLFFQGGLEIIYSELKKNPEIMSPYLSI